MRGLAVQREPNLQAPDAAQAPAIGWTRQGVARRVQGGDDPFKRGRQPSSNTASRRGVPSDRECLALPGGDIMAAYWRVPRLPRPAQPQWKTDIFFLEIYSYVRTSVPDLKFKRGAADGISNGWQRFLRPPCLCSFGP